MEKVIAFLKSWQFMLGFFCVLCITSTVLLTWGLTHDDEPGLMPTAPQWERDKFPLTVCGTVEHSADAATEIRAGIRITNERLGFEALRYMEEDAGPHGRACLVIVDTDTGVSQDPGDIDSCTKEGGWTHFSFDAEGSGDWAWNDPDAGDGGDAQWLNDMRGTHDVIVVLCNVPLAEERSLALQHELGHVLGLAHDPGNEQSIMQPVLHGTPDGEFPPHITDHDRALLRDLYAPRGR